MSLCVLWASKVDLFIVPTRYTSFPLNLSVKWMRVDLKQSVLSPILSWTVESRLAPLRKTCLGKVEPRF